MTAAGISSRRRARRRPSRLTSQRAYVPAALCLILLGIYLLSDGGQLDSIAVLGIANNALPLALVAIGETFVILTNGIDLSVASTVTLSNVVTASMSAHGSAPLAIVVALAAGAAMGLVNGAIVSFARIPSLIATLATSSIVLGICLIVLPSPGGLVPMWLSNWTAGSVGGVPVACIWLFAACVIGWLVLSRTRFGLWLRALGGSERSSWSAGVKVTQVRLLAYVLAGLLAGLAGVVLAGLTQSGDPTIGGTYLLDSIAAVVVGGTSLVGGVGTITGSVLGAIALSLVSAVLLQTGISTNYQYIVSGLIVIAALLAYSVQSRATNWARAVRLRSGRAHESS